MAANAGMVAGSRDGVVTIRRDGDGPAVRLPRASLLFIFGSVRSVSICAGVERGGPCIWPRAVRRQAN
jgi:hypothetical protein